MSQLSLTIYFAENETAEYDWKERFDRFEGMESNIVLVEDKSIGWIMYDYFEMYYNMELIKK